MIAALSLLATVLVLVEGGRGSSRGESAMRAVASYTPRTVTAALPPAAAPAGDAAAADTDGTAGAESDAAADDAALDDTGTLGDDAASSGEDASGEPAADPAPGPDADERDPGSGGSGPASADEQAADPDPQPTKIRHVFVIALAGHGLDATFGPQSAAPYLSRRLRPKGTLLSGYRPLGTADLPDYLAMIGGQPPNASTNAGCPTFAEIPPSTRPTASGEIRADGCVFPNTVLTVADQLTSRGLDWRAYVEDLDRGPARTAACRRPASNAADDTVRARVGDGYATRHNPFVYYHSLLDLGDCDAKDGPLERLEGDLRAVRSTPNYAFVAPNLCNDGSESPCVDGAPGGLPAADAFLARWVPKILASPAYRKDGLLIVTFAGGAQPPNGALLVSRFAKAGATAGGDYGPYSLLRSVEDLFALRPIARAASARSFAPTVLGDAYASPPGDG
ncbi:phosphoesterase [Conexibacter woesei DSM 14684]|uniref:Phosphoesterase n=2 Tax=Conexibacter TaxID=191494 RepID=D3FD46_CONWI|nr:phosphoesterase [Conexibacter woesei DSM 14684]